MEPEFDYKQFIILLVDDEEPALRYFKRAFQDQFRILTANNADEGLNLLREHKHEVGVLIADSRMPGHSGVWLLEQARDIKPHLVRIYWSAYNTSEELLAACRIGIHKYITCPWDPPALEQTLRGALEQFAEVNAMAEQDKNFAVLYVDDEGKSLKMFRLLCEDQFRVMTASTAHEGLDLDLLNNVTGRMKTSHLWAIQNQPL